MKQAAKDLDFERAAILRDELLELKASDWLKNYFFMILFYVKTVL